MLARSSKGKFDIIKLRKIKVDILLVNNEKNLSSLELFQVIKNKIKVKKINYKMLSNFILFSLIKKTNQKLFILNFI